MKTIRYFFLSLLSVLLSTTYSVAQNEFGVKVEISGRRTILKQTITENTASLLSEMNNAVAKNRKPKFAKSIMTDDTRQKIAALWDTGSMTPVDSVLRLSLSAGAYGDTQLRDIAVMLHGRGETPERETLVINFNKDGIINDINIALNSVSMNVIDKAVKLSEETDELPKTITTVDDDLEGVGLVDDETLIEDPTLAKNEVKIEKQEEKSEEKQAETLAVTETTAPPVEPPVEPVKRAEIPELTKEIKRDIEAYIQSAFKKSEAEAAAAAAAAKTADSSIAQTTTVSPETTIAPAEETEEEEESLNTPFIISQSEIMRLKIADFLNKLRTAYNCKDMDYLEKVYANNALIINAVERKGKLRPNTDFIKFALGTDKYDVQVRSKREYLNKLAVVFDRNLWVHLNFKVIDMVEHATMKNVFGVKLFQTWNSENYSDTGYLFLMIDCRKEYEMEIFVRAWAPEDVFNINTFSGFHFFDS